MQLIIEVAVYLNTGNASWNLAQGKTYEPHICAILCHAISEFFAKAYPSTSIGLILVESVHTHTRVQGHTHDKEHKMPNQQLTWPEEEPQEEEEKGTEDRAIFFDKL